MHNIRFEIENKTVFRKTPENWNELTLKQLLFVVPLVMLTKVSEDTKAEILFYFLKMKWKLLKNMNNSQLEGLFPAVDWLFAAPELTKNPYPDIKIGKITYKGLADEMKDISVSQFAFADKFLALFLKKKEEEYLNNILATIYVPSGKSFKKENIEDIAAKFAKIKLNKRLVMLAFFVGSRKKLTETFQDIFNRKTKRRGGNGWLGFFYELAGPKIGTYTEVAEMLFTEMLGIMRKLNEDAREMAKRNRR